MLPRNLRREHRGHIMMLHGADEALVAIDCVQILGQCHVVLALFILLQGTIRLRGRHHLRHLRISNVLYPLVILLQKLLMRLLLPPPARRPTDLDLQLLGLQAMMLQLLLHDLLLGLLRGIVDDRLYNIFILLYLICNYEYFLAEEPVVVWRHRLSLHLRVSGVIVVRERPRLTVILGLGDAIVIDQYELRLIQHLVIV